MNDKKTKQAAALYWEVCFLRRLLRMGFIDPDAFEGLPDRRRRLRNHAALRCNPFVSEMITLH